MQYTPEGSGLAINGVKKSLHGLSLGKSQQTGDTHYASTGFNQDLHNIHGLEQLEGTDCGNIRMHANFSLQTIALDGK